MDETFEAQVIAAFGRHLRVRDTQGQEAAARPFGRALSPVCGDLVLCRRDSRHDEVHVLEIRPRRGALYRSNLRGAGEPVVAHLTQLFVVLAPLPAPDLFVIDRYLAAAVSVDLPATLVLNKADLPVSAELATELAALARAGHASVSCSARSQAGLAGLEALARGAVSALVGQSGVGKSSLVQCLVPGATVEIGALMREEEGRHTTTASRMFTLAGGGFLIDSPGVRDFAPAVDRLDERTLGFLEVERLGIQCRFQDCRHLREPGCAVRAAAESGAVHPRRYESYRRLRRLKESLKEARGLKPRAAGRRRDP